MCLVLDKHSPPPLAPDAFTVYVDNAIFIGTAREAVREAMEKARAAV